MKNSYIRDTYKTSGSTILTPPSQDGVYGFYGVFCGILRYSAFSAVNKTICACEKSITNIYELTGERSPPAAFPRLTMNFITKPGKTHTALL